MFTLWYKTIKQIRNHPINVRRNVKIKAQTYILSGALTAAGFRKRSWRLVSMCSTDKDGFREWRELYLLEVRTACHHKLLLFVENSKDHKDIVFLSYLRSKKSKERKSRQWWKWQENKTWLDERKGPTMMRSGSELPDARQVQKEVTTSWLACRRAAVLKLRSGPESPRRLDRTICWAPVAEFLIW